jgi:hypothetical protein
MDTITISGVKPYDGRYELDITGSPLTTREWGWIKKHAGYLPVTIGDDGFADPELIAVLAVIALRRSGTIEAREVPAVYDRIADAPFGSTISLEFASATEGDADPPPLSSTGSSNSSGPASTMSSEPSELRPSRTGGQLSATSGFAPATLET